ncbi:MAG: nucleoside deaminase [Candidatus Nomurabacteria bacterium]|nr:nucleoside deaminase [Candidatus Nomurabacteria bacterium]
MEAKKLKHHWENVFEQAWISYCENSIPIGAIIINHTGEVIAVGRNKIYDKSDDYHHVFYHQLGHAELNALLKVSKHEYPDIEKYILLTSFEPCPMCLGAFVMSRIKTLYFAAHDLIAGSSDLINTSAYMKEKNLTVHGPFDFVQSVQIALICEFMLHKRPKETDKLFLAWSKTDYKAVELGKKWFNNEYLIKLKKENLNNKNAVKKIFKEVTRYYLNYSH